MHLPLAFALFLAYDTLCYLIWSFSSFTRKGHEDFELGSLKKDYKFNL